MEEYVDILDAHGNFIGKSCLKSEAHKKGLFHPTVHVWFFTNEGQILLQKRKSTKETFPSLWDVSVAGHVMEGEDIRDAVLREVKEEIGLSVSKRELHHIGIEKCIHHHPNGILDCEFQYIFLVELKKYIRQLIKQEDEVDDIKLFNIKVLLKNSKIDIVPNTRSYYQFVYDEIRKRIGN